MGAGMIKGDVEQIQQSATKLGDFSTELNDTLTRLRGTVDDISAITYGTASETLTSTYYQLDTDLKTYVDCALEDGRYIRIYYTSMDYPATIYDEPIDDLFEGITYAG